MQPKVYITFFKRNIKSMALRPMSGYNGTTKQRRFSPWHFLIICSFYVRSTV